MLTLKLLFLLMVANGAPVLMKKALGGRGAWPVDGGALWRDGRPVLGPSKTWRGLAAAVALSGGGALIVGWPVWLGAVFGGCAMLGDLFSSFLKRRLGLPSSAMALGLDQVPESLLPLLAVRGELGLGWGYVLWLALLFLVLELAFSRVLFALHVRDRPY
jgi:CDP-2,3-bis-(O-geranylgeranyl)-sn-glycerol synthase